MVIIDVRAPSGLFRIFRFLAFRCFLGYCNGSVCPSTTSVTGTRHRHLKTTSIMTQIEGTRWKPQDHVKHLYKIHSP